MPPILLPPLSSPWGLRMPALAAALAVGVVMACPPAAAQATDATPRVSFTADPMRPSPVAAAPAGVAVEARDAALDPGEGGGLPRLEATHRSAAGRRAALIDGRWRAVGDAVGDLRVVAVGEADVVLTRGGERVTLSLLTVRTRPSTATRDAPPRKTRGAAE